MRRIFRVAKSAVVLSLVFMMTVDTANACRLFGWLFAHRGACCASSAPAMGVSMNSCCDAPATIDQPVVMAAPVVESFPVTDVMYGGDVIESSNCCNADMGGVVDGGYVDQGYYDGGYVESGEMIMDASPVDLAPTDTIVAPIPAYDSAPTPILADEATTTDAPVDAPAEATTDNPLAEPADDAGGDMFDAPADEPIPADADDGSAFDAPAEDGGGDLFDAPAGDAPADGGGDLFDNPPAEETAPGDDLFDGGGVDEAPADDAGDDLFSGGAASEETVPVSAEEEAPADTTSPEANGLDDLDDLFGQRRGDGMRVWTDNTGSYQTVGRLVVIAKTHVRLLKDNGRYSTVPLTRLSDRDLDYVMAVAAKLNSPQRLASR